MHVFPNALLIHVIPSMFFMRFFFFFKIAMYKSKCPEKLFSFFKSIALHIGRSPVDCSFVPRILKNDMF